MLISILTPNQSHLDQTLFNFDQTIENLKNGYLEDFHTYNYIVLGLIYLITIFTLRKNVQTILEYGLKNFNLDIREKQLKVQETILDNIQAELYKQQVEFKYQQEELYRKQKDIQSQELVLKYRIEDINRKESEIDHEYKMIFDTKPKSSNNKETQVEIITSKKRKIENSIDLPIALSRPRRACTPTTFYKKY